MDVNLLYIIRIAFLNRRLTLSGTVSCIHRIIAITVDLAGAVSPGRASVAKSAANTHAVCCVLRIEKEGVKGGAGGG